MSGAQRRPALLLLCAVVLAAAGLAPGAPPPPSAPALGRADRSRPPSPEPPRPLKLPPVQHLSLKNGVPVHLVELHEVPTVNVLLVVRTGSVADPLDKAGLAALTADMLDEGAGGKDSLALADALDFLGADVSTSASWDYSTVGLYVPVARLGPALGLMGDVALRPDFPPKELDRLKKRALTGLLQARSDPRQLASFALSRAVFGDHRYGLPAAGNATTISGLDLRDLRDFHARRYVADNAVLVVVGDVTREVVGLLDQAFGAWAKGAAVPSSVPEPLQVKGRQLVLIDKPDAAQSVIRVGRVSPPRNNPDYHAIEVMNTLLGASFTSRLNDNLREQHGWAYGAGSGFGYRRVAGLFQASADVQTPSTADALGEMLKELDRIRTPATAEEVERARNYLALGYAEEFETTRQISSQIAEQVIYGLPEDFFSTFVPKALAVGVPAVAAAAGRIVDPANAAVVVVGDRKAIEAPLRALNVGPVVVRTVDDVMGPMPKVD